MLDTLAIFANASMSHGRRAKIYRRDPLRFQTFSCSAKQTEIKEVGRPPYFPESSASTSKGSLEHESEGFPRERSGGYNIGALKGGYQMKQPKHRYRVSVYLGKETYTQIEDLAKMMTLPVSTMTRVILETGLQISKQLEKGANENGI